MHISVVVLIKIPQRLDDWTWFLRSGGVIKVDELMAAYLLTQDREFLAKSPPVDLARNSFMHAIICYTSGGAPVHSDADSRIRL